MLRHSKKAPHVAVCFVQLGISVRWRILRVWNKADGSESGDSLEVTLDVWVALLHVDDDLALLMIERVRFETLGNLCADREVRAMVLTGLADNFTLTSNPAVINA